MTKKSDSVTIRDVAKQAGVSVATVSRLLNHNAPVSHEVAERINKVMEELNYVPQASARHLATRKTRTIGLLLTSMNYSFFFPLLRGLESVVGANGYNLLVGTYRSDLRDQYPPPIGPHNTDGVVVFVNALDDERLAQWHKMNFPVVLVHRTPPSPISIPCVTIENKEATQKMIDHLIDVHGRRHIVFLRGPANQEDSHWREMGYKASLEAHAIKYDPALVLWGEFDREKAYQVFQSFLLNNHPEFDAVFAGDDDAAVGVISALQDSGMTVPGSVSVVGFDDQYFSSFMSPSLTTIHAPTEEVGRSAGQQIFKILQDHTPDPITLLSTEVVIRQSCGCVA